MEYAQEAIVIMFFLREKKKRKIFGETDGDIEQCRGGGWEGAQYCGCLRMNS